MKRILAIALVLVMIAGVLPLEVFAEDEITAGEAVQETVEISEAAPSEEEPAEEAPAEEASVEEAPAEESVQSGEAPGEETLSFEGEQNELTEETLTTNPEDNILTPENFVEGYDPEDPWNRNVGDWTFFDYLYWSKTYDDVLEDCDGIITAAEAAEITDICAPNWGLTTLHGINLFTNLLAIDVSENFITDIDDLDPVCLPGLFDVVFWKCSLTGSVDFSGFTELEYLDLDDNSITYADVSGCPKLETLYIQNNGLEYINLSGCSALKNLYAGNNALSWIDLSSCTALTNVDLSINRLAELDLSACTNLESAFYFNQTPVLSDCAWYVPTEWGRYFMADLSTVWGEGEYSFESLIDRGIVKSDFYGLIEGNTVCGYMENYSETGPVYAVVCYDISTGSDFGDMYVCVNLIAKEFSFGLMQDYILMNQGESCEILLNIPNFLNDKVKLEAKEYIQQEWEPDSTVGVYDPAGLSIVNSSTVYAVEPGSYFLEYTLNFADGNTVGLEKIRVDVAASVQQDVLRASLPQKTLSVKLFSTDYAAFDVLLEREELMNAQLNPGMIPVLEDEGVSIVSARFEDDAVNNLFSIRIDDDRRLQVIPTTAALEAGKAAKYSSAVVIGLKGREEPLVTAEKLTMTVANTLPKLKAASVKMNSYTYYNFVPEAALKITGAKVSSVEVVSGAPDWLEVDSEAMAMRYLGAHGAKKSAKLKLNCSVEGYSVKIPVTVSVSVASTAPVIKLKGKVPVLSSEYDQGSVQLSISIPDFAKTTDVIKIIEGKSEIDYEEGRLNAWTNYYDGVTTLYLKTYGYDDGRDHSYKVYVSCFGKQLVVPVKVTSHMAKYPYVSAKLSGAIDLSVPNSVINVSVSLKNYNECFWYGEGLTYRIYDETDKSNAPGRTYVTDSFGCTFINDSQYSANPQLKIWAKNPENIKSGHVYKLELYQEYGEAYEFETGEDSCIGIAELKVPVKLTVKSSLPAKVKPSLTAKISGKPDTLNTNREMKVSFQFKNFSLDPETDLFDLLYGENNPFAVKVYRTYDAVTKKTLAYTAKNLCFDSGDDGYQSFHGWLSFDSKGNISCFMGCNDYLNPKDKFAVVLSYDDGSTCLVSKPVSFQVTRSKVTLKLDAGSATMYLKDNQSTLDLAVSAPALSWCTVNKAVLTGSAANLFELVNEGFNLYSLRWKGGTVPKGALKYAGKTVTVTIKVCLNNNSHDVINVPYSTYDATISFKVKIR